MNRKDVMQLVESCKILQTYQARPSIDGAGVHLNRLFWRKDTFDMDPFLLLDIFDSKNPTDYQNGFPLHPHRGIETLTYLIEGEIHHKDSLGNEGVIHSGECQWMSAGSGILHEEMPKPVSHMQGFQLWINLARDNKMSDPTYLALQAADVPVYAEGHCRVHVIAGEFGGVAQQKMPGQHAVEIYDIQLEAGKALDIPVRDGYHSFLVPLEGSVTSDDTVLERLMAARFSTGDTITLQAGEEPLRLAFFSGAPLEEPIAWGGSLVMNTEQELELARKELREGTFIKVTDVSNQ